MLHVEEFKMQIQYMCADQPFLSTQLKLQSVASLVCRQKIICIVFSLHVKYFGPSFQLKVKHLLVRIFHRKIFS